VAVESLTSTAAKKGAAAEKLARAATSTAIVAATDAIKRGPVVPISARDQSTARTVHSEGGSMTKVEAKAAGDVTMSPDMCGVHGTPCARALKLGHDGAMLAQSAAAQFLAILDDQASDSRDKRPNQRIRLRD
jgi:hypothetical protein